MYYTVFKKKLFGVYIIVKYSSIVRSKLLKFIDE